MTIKKSLLIIFIFIIVFTSTSCKAKRELEDMGIVISTGMDLEGEQILITVEVIIPQDRIEENDSNSIILQGKGDSVSEAIGNITLSFDKELFFSHNVVIIFGEELAEKGIGRYIDYFTKGNEPRESAYLVVAKGSKAYEVMGINNGISNSSGEYLESLIDNTGITLKSRSLTMNEYLKYYYDRETPLLGVVEKKEVLNVQSSTGVDGTRRVLEVYGGAPFYKDELLGYYTAEEMIGFNFIIDEVDEGIIVFDTPEEVLKYSKIFSKTANDTTFKIIDSGTKINIEIIDGEPKVNIDVNANGLIIEDNSGSDINILKVRDEVQRACGEQIKEYIDMTMKKAQELRNDNFGINHIFHATHPKEWNMISDSWHYEFSKMEYSIDVNVEIIRTGLTNTPSNIIKREDH